MKRRAEHLVEKRDGRTEFLRATKLARSIHLALCSVGIDEDWRALDVAGTVLAGLRQRRSLGGDAPERASFTTAELADAVQQVLVVTGQPLAAAAYGAVAADRQRRRHSLATLGRGVAVVGDHVADGLTAGSGVDASAGTIGHGVAAAGSGQGAPVAGGVGPASPASPHFRWRPTRRARGRRSSPRDGQE